MNKKNCDLCMKNRAKMYCESDEANLCWDCDSKVHSANFLVAKHTRNLLCHSCQNPTPWSSTGPQLSPTLSVCNSCLENPAIAAAAERVEENNYQTETDDDEEDDEYVSSDSEIDDDDDDDDDDDGNQVVPLSSSSTFSSPEGSVSCSDSYGGLLRAGDGGGGATAAVAVCSSSSAWKRIRESDCIHYEDEEACSSSLNCHSPFEENKGTSSSIGFLRPMKVLRTNELCE